MQTVPIDADTLRGLAARQGIDSVKELANRCEISEWVLYKALRSGRMRPSHTLALAALLDVEVDDFASPEPEPEAAS